MPAQYDIFSKQFFTDPDPVFHAMRSADPVYWEPTLEAWILTRYRDIKAALNDPRFSVQRNARIRTATPTAAKDQLAACYRYLDDWMIFTDEPRHKRLRSVLGPAYTPSALRSFAPHITELVAKLLAPAQAHGSFDVIADLAAPLTGAINAERIGFPVDMVPDVRRWSDDVFLLFGSGIVTEEVVDTAHRSLTECHDYARTVLHEQRDRPGAGLLGRLVGGLNDGIIEHDDEVVASAAMLMIGGHEAARHMIGNGLIALLQHPAELAALQHHPELIDDAIEELLRYGSPPLSALRYAAADYEIDGITIHAGQFVFNMLRAGNHDPAVFTHPDTIDIRRAQEKHLGFGFGLHYCTGSFLATMQVKLALQALVALSPRLAIAADELDWVPSLSSRGVRSLPVEIG